MAMNIIDIVFDVWILTLPMRVIKNLHMTLTRKIAVGSVFLLGALYVLLRGEAPLYADIWSAVSLLRGSDYTTPVN